MERKICIESFFIDYYDHWFDSRHDEGVETWHRKVHGYSPSKTEQFRKFWNAGIDVPEFGIAKSIGKILSAKTEVVAYDDEYGHATSGKYRTTLGEVMEKHPERLVSEFVYVDGPAKHTRVVHIGTQALEFTMTSDHEWLSNRGNDVQMEFIWHGYSQKGPVPFGALPEHRHRCFGYPLYAIDYIECPERGLLAIDLNLCPGLSNTPVEDRINAKDCATLIKSWAQDYKFDGKSRMLR